MRLPGRWGDKGHFTDDAASGPGTYQSCWSLCLKPHLYWKRQTCSPILNVRGFIPGAGLSITAFRLHRRNRRCFASALQERPQIEVVKNQHASRIALVPVAAEPTGIEKLRELVVLIFCIYRAAKPSCLRIYVTGRRYFCPDHRFGYLATEGLGIGWSATLGAVLALISGVVHFGDIPVVWNIVWNATATFIAVIIISLLLDESGFFEWAALHVSRWGNGRAFAVYLYRFARRSGGGTVCQRWCGIDLTPIVIAMLLALGFSKGTTLAFVMAAGFIADTASLRLSCPTWLTSFLQTSLGWVSLSMRR